MQTPKNLVLPVVVAVTLLCCAAIQYWGYEHPALGIDDANIYFVYMKNVANGHGFVWNVGGEKVEGFTSFLWTITGAALYKLTPLYFGKLLFGVLLLLTFSTIYQSLLFVRRLNRQSGAIVPTDVVLLSIFLLPLGFVDWNVLSLMETGLWTFLLTSAILEVCRYAMGWKKPGIFRLELLIMAMVLTRPESSAYNLMLIAALFVFMLMANGKAYAIKVAALLLLVHVAVFAAITLWRLHYFGYPFPNTYYAKVSSSIKYNLVSSANYLVLFFYNYPVNTFIILMMLFLAASATSRLRKEGLKTIAPEEKVAIFLFLFSLAGLCLPLLTGGDHFKYNRFYQPLLPIIAVGACNGYCWNKYVGIKLPAARKSVTMLLLAFSATMFLSSKYTMIDFLASHNRILHYPVIQDFIVSSNGRKVGEKMNETFDSTGSYPSVGTLATGGFGFIYHGKTVDLLGLNNVAMAHADPSKRGYRNHASFDKKVFYRQMPDMMGSFYGATVVSDTSTFVLPENLETFRTDYANMVYPIYKNIYDDHEFHNAYQPALIRNKAKSFFIFDYFSNSYLSRIDTSKFLVIMLKRKFKPTS